MDDSTGNGGGGGRPAPTWPQAVYEACLDEIALAAGEDGIAARELWVAAGAAAGADVASDGPLCAYLGRWLARTPDVRVRQAAAAAEGNNASAATAAAGGAGEAGDALPAHATSYGATDALRARLLGVVPDSHLQDQYRAVLAAIARTYVARIISYDGLMVGVATYPINPTTTPPNAHDAAGTPGWPCHK